MMKSSGTLRRDCRSSGRGWDRSKYYAAETTTGERTRLRGLVAPPSAHRTLISYSQIGNGGKEEVRLGEGAETSTRGACAPQNWNRRCVITGLPIDNRSGCPTIGLREWPTLSRRRSRARLFRGRAKLQRGPGRSGCAASPSEARRTVSDLYLRLLTRPYWVGLQIFS